MENRKYQKIAFVMTFVSIICLIISGYWMVQACINPKIPDRFEKEDVIQTANNSSVSEENPYNPTETIQKTTEIQEPTTETTESDAVTKESQNPNVTVDNQQDTENEMEEKVTTAFNGVTLTQSDILLLEKTTYAEAGICDDDTQRAVAATILERAAESEQTIEEVVFAPGQFRCAIDGEIYLITKYGNILTTSEMAKKVSEVVSDAIANGSGISGLLGGEPLFFYSGGGLTSYEAAKRATISVSVTLDRMTFYRVWD